MCERFLEPSTALLTNMFRRPQHFPPIASCSAKLMHTPRREMTRSWRFVQRANSVITALRLGSWAGGVGPVLDVFQDVISGRRPIHDLSGLVACETLVHRQAHSAASSSR